LAVLGVFLDLFLDPSFGPFGHLAILASEGPEWPISPGCFGPKWPFGRPAKRGQKEGQKGVKKGCFEKGSSWDPGVPNGQKGVRKHADSSLIWVWRPNTPFWAKWPQIGLEKECFRTPFWDLNHPKSGFWPVLGFGRVQKGSGNTPFLTLFRPEGVFGPPDPNGAGIGMFPDPLLAIWNPCFALLPFLRVAPNGCF
jgi:hypothetical protein